MLDISCVMVDGGGGVEGKERGGQHGVTVISSARKGWSRVIINSILRLFILATGKDQV